MDKNEVGQRIRFFREKKNWTQNRLANEAGISPTYIYQVERGLKSPTVEYLSYICSALGISLGEFFKNNLFASQDTVAALTENQRKLLNAFLESMK